MSSGSSEALGELLDAIVGMLDRYVILPGRHERVALALYVAHTWAIDGAHATPYILVVSPEKRSGKSRLLEVLELLVARSWRLTGASEAALFRKISGSKPTLLLDEIDAIFGSHAERTEPLRQILNAGNRPGANVARCVGENLAVSEFSVYCPKVLAGIDSGHHIPDTIRDRAVMIHMQRRTRAEPVERFRHRDADAEAESIREGLERWAAGAVDLLLAADPDMPPGLDDRAAEAWEPLLAIGDTAGGEWPTRAREAAVALSGDEDRDEMTTGALLLRATRDAFGEADRISTAALLTAINADEQLPFGDWRDGKGLDGRGIAKVLRRYGIAKPRTIRIGEGTAKGYMREWFSESWERWLPPSIERSQASQPSRDTGSVTQIRHKQADVTDVTAVTDRSDSNGVLAATDAEEADVERVAAKFPEAV